MSLLSAFSGRYLNHSFTTRSGARVQGGVSRSRGDADLRVLAGSALNVS